METLPEKTLKKGRKKETGRGFLFVRTIIEILIEDEVLKKSGGTSSNVPNASLSPTTIKEAEHGTWSS